MRCKMSTFSADSNDKSSLCTAAITSSTGIVSLRRVIPVRNNCYYRSNRSARDSPTFCRRLLSRIAALAGPLATPWCSGECSCRATGVAPILNVSSNCVQSIVCKWHVSLQQTPSSHVNNSIIVELVEDCVFDLIRLERCPIQKWQFALGLMFALDSAHIVGGNAAWRQQWWRWRRWTLN